jgi:hypothetical protein
LGERVKVNERPTHRDGLVTNGFQAARAERGGVAEERKADCAGELPDKAVTDDPGCLGVLGGVGDVV